MPGVTKPALPSPGIGLPRASVTFQASHPPACSSALWQAEVKAFLEGVYGLSVAKVNPLNVQGKKTRGKTGFFRWVAECLE